MINNTFLGYGGGRGGGYGGNRGGYGGNRGGYGGYGGIHTWHLPNENLF